MILSEINGWCDQSSQQIIDHSYLLFYGGLNFPPPSEELLIHTHIHIQSLYYTFIRLVLVIDLFHSCRYYQLILVFFSLREYSKWKRRITQLKINVKIQTSDKWKIKTWTNVLINITNANVFNFPHPACIHTNTEVVSFQAEHSPNPTGHKGSQNFIRVKMSLSICHCLHSHQSSHTYLTQMAAFGTTW